MYLYVPLSPNITELKQPLSNRQRGWSFSPTTRELGLARVLNNPGSSFTDGPTGSAGAGLAGDGPIAKERLIKTSLDYATELEAIV